MRNLADAGVRVSEAGAGELQRVGLPEGVKQVIARRLARLSPPATESLRVAAVIGRDFDAGLLERVLSLDEDEFLNALDEVLAAGVVVEACPTPALRVLPRADPGDPVRGDVRRRGAPASIGASARSSRPAGADERNLERARASLHPGGTADDGQKAITYARRAGEQATAVLSHQEAAEHYSRALDVLERSDPDALELRCELLLPLGEALVRAGERGTAWPTFRRRPSWPSGWATAPRWRGLRSAPRAAMCSSPGWSSPS